MSRYKLNARGRTIAGINRYSNWRARNLAWEKRTEITVTLNGRTVATYAPHPQYFGPFYVIETRYPVCLTCGGQTPNAQRQCCDPCIASIFA